MFQGNRKDHTDLKQRIEYWHLKSSMIGNYKQKV